MLRNAVGGGDISFPGKKRYEGVRFNIISVTRGWVGVKFPGKKSYVTFEWPLTIDFPRSPVSLPCTVLTAAPPPPAYLPTIPDCPEYVRKSTSNYGITASGSYLPSVD